MAKTLFSCVMDATPKYGYQALLWAQSLVSLSGRAPDELVVHAIEGGNLEHIAALRRMGVRVSMCEPHDTRHPCSNKLVQLRSEALAGADFVVLCDCDTLFTSDVSAWIGGSAIRAKHVDTANPSHAHWKKIFTAAGFSDEPRIAKSTVTLDQTYWNNCNGGLYVIPATLLARLAEPWSRWNAWLLDHPEVLHELGTFTDQVSFALAMHELGEEVDPLPMELNFPTHLDLGLLPDWDLAPRVLHHHHRLDKDGLLLPVGRPAVDQAVARVNDLICAKRLNEFALGGESRLAYRRDASTGVWRPTQETGEFAYSDGAAEEAYIHRTLVSAKDVAVGSLELELAIRDWPSRYHLGRQRPDLLRPLQPLLTGNILELGSGCGAITRFLGEGGARVTAIEGSPARAAMTRLRCRDLENVEVYCERAASFSGAAEHSFDVATLIGVLEYSPVFAPSADPFAQTLALCQRWLKDSGVVIIAIENQLGLKYWAGAPEDHHGVAFHGINDLYTESSATTLGREALGRKLSESGFVHQQWLYPLPDYKFPTAVLTDAGACLRSTVMTNLLSNAAANDQGAGYMRTFAEEQAWPVLSENGLVPDLANSFLIVASREPLAKQETAQPLAYLYSTCRSRPFAKQTVLRESEAGISIERKRLYASEGKPGGPFKQSIDDELASEGKLLIAGLVRVVNRPGWTLQELAHWARPWVEFLEQQRVDSAEETPQIPGRYFDCAPFNVIQKPGGELVAFDLEWVFEALLPLPFVLARGIAHSLGKLHSVAQPADHVSTELGALTRALLSELGFTANEAEWSAWLAREEALQHVATGISGGGLPTHRLAVRPTRLLTADEEKDRKIGEVLRQLEQQRELGIQLRQTLAEQRAQAEAREGVLLGDLSTARAEVENYRSNLAKADHAVETAETKLKAKIAELGSANAELGAANSELGATRFELGRTRSELNAARQDLQALHESMGMRVLELARKVPGLYSGYIAAKGTARKVLSRYRGRPR